MEEKILVDKKGYQQLLDEIDKIELELISIGKEKELDLYIQKMDVIVIWF